MEKPLITQSDYRVLRKLVTNIQSPEKLMLGKHITRAAILEDDRVSPGTIRLNSYVEITDIQSKQTQRIRIVMPDSVDLKQRWVSVFAPISVALLGHEKGDIVRFRVDGAERELKIVSVVNHMG